jgi:hypothetical protein
MTGSRNEYPQRSHDCITEISADIKIAKRAADGHEWFDALNHFAQAVQIAVKYYPWPEEFNNEVDTLLSRCVGYIGGQIMDAVSAMPKESYLEFKLVKQGEKTSVWDVMSKRHGFPLGTISWWGAWRQYAFFPYEQTGFNRDCTREITAFMDQQMKARKEGRKHDQKS